LGRLASRSRTKLDVALLVIFIFMPTFTAMTFAASITSCYVFLIASSLFLLGIATDLFESLAFTFIRFTFFVGIHTLFHLVNLFKFFKIIIWFQIGFYNFGSPCWLNNQGVDVTKFIFIQGLAFLELTIAHFDHGGKVLETLIEPMTLFSNTLTVVPSPMKMPYSFTHEDAVRHKEDLMTIGMFVREDFKSHIIQDMVQYIVIVPRFPSFVISLFLGSLVCSKIIQSFAS
jgi:hypothetical protein